MATRTASLRAMTAGFVAVTASLTACGGSSGSEEVAVPDGATFCSVFNEDYLPIINAPTAFGEDGFAEESEELVRLASIMATLAPSDISEAAQVNVSYHEGVRDVASVSEFVPGNLDTFQYGLDNCS